MRWKRRTNWTFTCELRSLKNRLSQWQSADGLITFPPPHFRDILEFWSSIGEAQVRQMKGHHTHLGIMTNFAAFQFPRLARLARFILASSGAPCPIPLQQPSICKLGPHEIGTRLNLRCFVCFFLPKISPKIYF